MGLYDSLKCRWPLPDPAHQSLVFQTKDLACLLDRYLILDDGRLAREIVEREWVDTPGQFLGGHFIATDRWWEECYHHGDVRFYTSTTADQTWVEYIARFTRGRLHQIFREEDVQPPLIRTRLDITEPPWDD